MEEKISSIEEESDTILQRFKDKLAHYDEMTKRFDKYDAYLQNSINSIEDAKTEINHTLEVVKSIGKQDATDDVISKAQSTSWRQPPQFDAELDQELNQEPEGLGPDLPLDIPDETIPDEENLELREDTRVSGNNYSLEEQEWLDAHLKDFVRLYKKLYPRDLGTIIDENGLDQMIEADAHLMYQYHAIISSRVVREKFDITHRNLLNAYRKRNTEQGSLFNESLIYEYETALNNISQIRY